MERTILAERWAFALLGVALVVFCLFHLIPALLAGMLFYSLLHRLDVRLRHWKLVSQRHTRKLALATLVIFTLIIASALVVGVLWLWRARHTALPELLANMADVLDSARTWMGNRWIPEDWIHEESLYAVFIAFLKKHAHELKLAGTHAGKTLAHILAGLALGAFAAFHHPTPEGPKPLADALSQRLKRLLNAFEAVVYAQVKISAINTLLTTLYLFILLPLCGVHLPMRFTLVALTFFAGMLPVLGNVFSNTAIVLISLGENAYVAIGSLVFLVLVHKLEYFINAKIVGKRIQAQPWEVLSAMVIMEVILGTPGLVFAPILYAYIKGELLERHWV